MRWTYGRSLALVPRRTELPAFLNARNLTGEGVEVGVQRGLFSEVLLESWAGRRLHIVDPWKSYDADAYLDNANVSQGEQDAIHDEAVARLRRFGDRVQVHRRPSLEAADDFADHTLDFVYLDGRHDYASVLDDLAAWHPKLRHGGILAGHDYVDGQFHGTDFGVRRAVKEFCESHGLVAWSTYFDTPWISFIIAADGGPARPIERFAGTITRTSAGAAMRVRGTHRPRESDAPRRIPALVKGLVAKL